MKIGRIVPLVMLLFLANQSFGAPKDSTLLYNFPGELSSQKSSISWLQLGFRVGYNFSLLDKYAPTDEMTKLFSGEFGAFVRLGKFVYFETGIGYFFHKGHYASTYITPPLSNEVVETRFLQIPLKAVGCIGLKNKFAFFPAAGVLYQPLIQVSKNYISYSKDNISPHQFLFSASIGVRISFFYAEIGYRKSLTPFFSDRKSNKPSYLSLMLGFMF